MNRLDKLFQNKKQDVLSIYYTAGFPKLNDTVPVLAALQKAGVDLVEIGIPYSDPVADGETIQASDQRSLKNGMTLKVLFEQIKDIRSAGITMPVVLMGYFNPIFQYGVEAFCKQCKAVGVDGLIIPDLPFDEYNLHYKEIFEANGIFNILLITPQTSDERVRMIDESSNGFIYMVSSASVTGSTSGVDENMEAYFERINKLNLKNPRLVGFGIKDKESFNKAAQFSTGAIIGSQFVRVLDSSGDNLSEGISNFIQSLR